jgi:hypothetical protein
MIKEFQSLQKQLIKNLKERKQLEQDLLEERKGRLDEKKQIFLDIIEQIDLLDKKIVAESEKAADDELRLLQINNKYEAQKLPFLNILAQYGVQIMEPHLYSLRGYAVEVRTVSGKKKARTGYLYNGGVLRKAHF